MEAWGNLDTYPSLLPVPSTFSLKFQPGDRETGQLTRKGPAALNSFLSFFLIQKKTRKPNNTSQGVL